MMFVIVRTASVCRCWVTD